MDRPATSLGRFRWKLVVVFCLGSWAAPVSGTELPPLRLPEGVGGNIHFTRGHERDLDLIRDVGFKFIHTDFGRAGIERKRGEHDFSAYDELTTNLDRRGLRPLYILDDSNPL